MATSKTTISSRTISKSGASSRLSMSGSATVTRSSSTSKQVEMTVELTFTLGGGTSESWLGYGYEITAWGNTKAIDDGAGWTDKTVKSSSVNWYGNNQLKRTWTRKFDLTGKSLTFQFYVNGSGAASGSSNYDYKSRTSPLEISLNVPTYSGSGGGTTTVGSNKITASISPTSVNIGESATINLTATAGTNNSITKIEINGDGVKPSDQVETSSVGWGNRVKTVIVTPTSIGSKTYTIKITSGINSATVSKNLSLNVTQITPVISSASINPTKVNNVTGGVVTLYATTNTKTALDGYNNSFSYYVNGIFGGRDWSSTSVFVNSGDRITVKAYDGVTEKESSSSKLITVQGYTPVKINSITIVPKILKDNLSTPDLVNIIERGSVSVSGSATISWYYRQSTTTSGLSGASWTSLGVSGTSFSNLDMTQKVNKGNYYQIYAIASGSDNSDYSTYSEIYQIPNNPGAPSITRIIPKADPSNGYSKIIKENKIYYGSGLFLLWNNPTIQSSQLPISEIEIIYQSKKETDTIFGETKIAQITYNKVLEEGEITPDSYPLSKESGASNGGGADLEVESLYETKIGIRITDTLGQYTDTFYTLKNYFKAESPIFGGNLVVSQNTFRPFTCIENDRIIFSSSVARSNSQDKLLYFIDCYINDRKTTVKVIEGVPISTNAFSDSNINSGDILYPENATGNEDIIIKKENATTIRYEVKNKFLKDKLLSNIDLRTPKGNLNAVYNDDFVDVIYKISVRDDFDSRSTVYNSISTNIKYIEAPTLNHNNNIEIGINRYLQSENPFYDDSIILLNSLSDNNDRIVNPGESIIFKFKRARDYNGADYLTTMVGDVIQYNIYVSRNDDIVNNNYDKLDYTLLKTFNAALSSDGGDLRKAYPNDSNDEYYYLEYPLTTYQESKFVIFKIEAIDSKNQKSDFIYANTYLVPCRATSMDFHISNVRLYSDKVFSPSFKNKVNDFGASIFVNNKYNYNNYPNYERNYSVGTNNNKQQFNRQGYIIFEGSLNGDFNNEIISLQENQYSNYFSQTINLNNFLGGKKYPDILDLEYDITDFPQEWKIGLEKKDIKKIFFRVTYKIAYGFKDLTKDNFDDKYLIITSTSAPYSFYEDAPTVSYRNHQVGINTKDFSADSTEGQKEVLIIQDNGSYNLVVFKGAEQRITLNLTERTFTAITNNNKEVTINFDSGVIDGMTIDGGEW